jgi:UDP-N-acetylmuramyl-tripeptide synthetase
MPMQLDSTVAALAWLRSRGARSLCTDSRRVQPGDAFIAWPGYAHDARQYVRAALDAGACAVLVEAQGADRFPLTAVPGVAALRGLKAASGELASAFAGQPSAALRVIAVTGTNGKTSTAWWTAQALGAGGVRCGVIGTLGIGEPPRAGGAGGAVSEGVAASGLTTPDPMALQAAFRRFVDTGFAACAIEASSIGIAEQRLAGTQIEVAVFTNLTHDHLDYHATMQAYWEAKRQLFAWPGLKAAVVNLDDAHGAELAASLPAGTLALWTYSLRGDARLRGSALTYEDGGLCFDVIEGPLRHRLRTALIGDYNAANLLAVIGAMRALGLPLADAVAACATLPPVPGRMQRVHGGAGAAPQVVVDYAHTPDALEQALRALQPFAAQRGGVLWCVFGCGGNRDAGKRPLMGEVAARLAQRVVVTSDNPRHEPPDAIVAQIVAGIARAKDVEVLPDRREAIAYAMKHADVRDVVLLAGKGHEDYQEIEGRRLPFSDAEVAAHSLHERGVAA